MENVNQTSARPRTGLFNFIPPWRIIHYLVDVMACVARSHSRRHFVCVFFLIVFLFLLLGLVGLRFVGCSCYSCSFSGDLAWHI